MIKKRRSEGKTDYKLRVDLLKSGKGRVVFRKSNRYITGQYVKSREAKDKVIVGVISKQLLKYGWPEKAVGSLKNLAASYLTGLLLGKKILNKGEKQGVADIGLLRSIKGSRIYAFLKGVVDSGVEVKVKKEMFPDKEKIRQEGKIKINIEEIKQNIQNKLGA